MTATASRMMTAAALASIVVMLVGCGSGSSTEVIDLSDGTIVVIAPPPSNGISMEALLQGELHRGPEGCLGVLGPDLGFVPVTFPHGTTVTNDVVLVLTVNGVEYGVGDAIALGGGFTDAQEVVDQGAHPTTCGAAEIFGASTSS